MPRRHLSLYVRDPRGNGEDSHLDFDEAAAKRKSLLGVGRRCATRTPPSRTPDSRSSTQEDLPGRNPLMCYATVPELSRIMAEANYLR